LVRNVGFMVCFGRDQHCWGPSMPGAFQSNLTMKFERWLSTKKEWMRLYFRNSSHMSFYILYNLKNGKYKKKNKPTKTQVKKQQPG
jgi:hypothetical protein